MVHNWSVDEEKALIEIWSRQKISGIFKGTSKDAKAYKEIAKLLEQDYQFIIGVKPVTNKIRALKKSHKKVADHNRITGNDRITCDHFEELDTLLGDRPSVNPPRRSVVDTSASLQSTSSEDSADAPQEALLDEASDLDGGSEEDGAPATDTRAAPAPAVVNVASDGSVASSSRTPDPVPADLIAGPASPPRAATVVSAPKDVTLPTMRLSARAKKRRAEKRDGSDDCSEMDRIVSKMMKSLEEQNVRSQVAEDNRIASFTEAMMEMRKQDNETLLAIARMFSPAARHDVVSDQNGTTYTIL